MKHVWQKTSPGLTLIELVVAMGIFALVAVMGMQSLTGTIRLSERLTEIDDDTADLTRAVALMRNDLTSILPMLFYPPQSAPISAVWQSEDDRQIGFSIGGQPSINPRSTDRHYAEWRFDAEDGTLHRRHWPTLLPVNANQVTNEATVLTNVLGLELRTYWEGTGWTDGHFQPITTLSSSVTQEDADEAASSGPPATYYSVLPLALEITIRTEKWGAIPLVQSLQ